MELKGIFLLAVFFISIGVLVYLHIKHKIDWKLVFILPIVAIIGFFFIIYPNKFNSITKFKFSELEVEMAKKEIDEKLKDGLEKSLEKIRDEAIEQRKSLELLINRANEIALKRNEIADDVSKKSQTAVNIAQKALEQSNSFGSINAEVQWFALREQYEETDNTLKEWERSKNIKRGPSNIGTPENIKVLDQNIIALEEQLLKRDKETIPSNIKELYRKRFRQYDSLKNVSERYKPFTERFSSIDFTLPSPPTLPSGFVISGGTISGGSFR
jgi:uncharacterized protein YoxC